MPSGNVSLNGINDAHLVKVLTVKEKYPGKMVFNPQQMQILTPPNNQPQQYNNVVITYTDAASLGGVIEILQHIKDT